MSETHQARLAETAGADEVLAEYMLRLDRGEVIHRETLFVEHPEVADELRAYFADCDGVAEFTGGEAPHAAWLVYPAPSPLQPLAETRTGAGTLPNLTGYEVLEELARGGMGVIYKARQFVGPEEPRPYRLVALKMIRGGQLASEADVQRFHSEAAVVARLDHPNIVPIYEVGRHEGQHYFSMKLIEGGSLAGFLGTLATRVPAHAAARLMATVARAVHHAHQRGILHRDLKPANILLDAQGQPHVTDFGLAKRVTLEPAAHAGPESPLTQSGLIVGTPNYMAPEQARARTPLSTAADVYSLGAILYEVLTGRPPFREPTPLATLVELLDKEPPPPRSLNPLLDRDLETICLKSLRKEPHERYGSAEALADDLERWQRGEPIQARPVSRWERGWKWARRRPAVAAMMLVSGAMTLLGMSSIVWALTDSVAAHRVKDGALYRSRVGLARYERVHSVARARAELDKCGVEYRRWEWHYLDRLCNTAQLTLAGHTGAAIGVAFHPDGTRLFSTDEDGVLRTWDAQTGQLLRTQAGHPGGGLHVAVSPDGRLLATAGKDGVIKLWEVATGEVRAVLRGHDKPVTCVAFRPDTAELASCGEDGTVRLWDVKTGTEKATVFRQEGLLSGVAFSPDGRRLAWTGWKGSIYLWDLQSSQEVFTRHRPRQSWTSVAFSPDGLRLAASSDRGLLEVLSVPSGVSLFQGRGPEQWLHAITFCPEGEYLATSAENGGVQVWKLGSDVEVGRLAHVLHGHERRTNGLAWSADGRRLASASTDGTVKVWDGQRNPEETVLTGYRSRITALAGDPTRSWLAAACSDHTVRISDARTHQELRVLALPEIEVRCLCVSADGQQLFSGTADGTLCVWDATTGELQRRWAAHEAAVCGLALHGAGGELFTAGTDGVLRRWDASTGQLLGEPGPKPGPLITAAFHRNGRYLATVAAESPKEIRLWDLHTGRVLHQLSGHKVIVTALSFDAQDRLASVSYDRTTRLWDVLTGAEVFLLSGHTQPALTVAFSPDGQLLATGGLDKTVRLYDGTPR